MSVKECVYCNGWEEVEDFNCILIHFKERLNGIWPAIEGFAHLKCYDNRSSKQDASYVWFVRGK